MHKNKQNNKVYIGQTCQKPEKRWNSGYGYKNCPRFYSAIIHYGGDNFEHIVLETGLSSEEANEKEKYYILKYKSQNENFGYNISEGGSSLSEYWKDENHKKEQSRKRKEFFQNNPEIKIANDERIIKLAKETAYQRAQKMKENYHQGKGLFNLNEKRKKQILCQETHEIFSSLTEAGKKYNISIGNISSVINGKRKTAGGYHWIEIEESMS